MHEEINMADQYGPKSAGWKYRRVLDWTEHTR